MTLDDLRKIAQQAAEDVQREAKVRYAVVLLSDGLTTTVVGAWVPDTDTLRKLLADAVTTLDDGSATIVNMRAS